MGSVVLCIGKKQDGRIIFTRKRGDVMSGRTIKEICEQGIDRYEYYKRNGIDSIPTNAVLAILQEILAIENANEDDGK